MSDWIRDGQRPRLQHRDHSSVYRFWPDGSIDVLQWRRVERSMGGWEEVVATGRTIEEAEAAFDDECHRRGGKSIRTASRRSNWGPKEIAR